MEVPDTEKVMALATKYKWLLALPALLLISTLTSYILSGLLGLLGIIAGAAIGLTAIFMAPVFTMKLANWRMKAIMKEAAKNPIETMRNVYIGNMKTIEEKDEKIKEFEAKLGDYHDKMTDFSRRYPAEVPRFQEVESKMSALLASQKNKQRIAKRKAVEYKASIDKGEAIYQMAMAAQDVVKIGSKIERQVFDDIKTQVSLDSITHSFNLAVADLSKEVDTEPDFQTPLLDAVVSQAGEPARETMKETTPRRLQQ